ncbi:hypothetical protein HK101_001564 [Irineochytrium annulatum]|nr:hypothetical protein HK101_001564 [Irineochytrium annulatum]
MDAVKGKEIVPTLDQANALIASCSEPKAAESLKVKCVAILGIVGKAKCNIPVNRVIGDFLVKRLATEPSVEVIAEILNALFDVYADEFFDYDSPVFVKGGYLEKLRKVAPALRSKVKAFDKRRNQLLRERADEAILNLKMFIQYKEGERKNKKK